ncbi:kinase-like domain-containing protein [Dactylonectria macrodidyma]|uniref:Autophagy-related protein 1 n=1 Tax=Dactylonectria macrodidyma TaxID=307937 RepID=A0A9P9ENA9_9HYPO|nr:kinase-like domain-containing protein [Dactylonectria macrodidyma]
MDNDIPHVVRDYRLATQFRKRHIIHAFDDPDAPPSSPQRKEYWKNERQQLGAGGQGRVILQTCTSGSRSYSQRAVKMIPLQEGGARRRYLRELETIIKFSHDKYARHFVKTLGWYETEDSLCIAMEFFPAGDLQTYVAEHALLREDDCREITSQILRALIVMHGEGFAHRDIKPQNVLIQQCAPSTSTQPGSWLVKLADFGISRMFHADTHGNSTLIGTEEFMAPELWDRNGAAKTDYPATDLWALGVMTFFILTKSRLFQNRRYSFQYERSPDRLFPRGSLDDCQVSLDGQDFIRALLRPNPNDRLDSNAAVNHAWIISGLQIHIEVPFSDSE